MSNGKARGGEGRRWRAGGLEVTQTQGTDATHNVNEGFFSFSSPKALHS